MNAARGQTRNHTILYSFLKSVGFVSVVYASEAACISLNLLLGRHPPSLENNSRRTWPCPCQLWLMSSGVHWTEGVVVDWYRFVYSPTWSARARQAGTISWECDSILVSRSPSRRKIKALSCFWLFSFLPAIYTLKHM